MGQAPTGKSKLPAPSFKYWGLTESLAVHPVSENESSVFKQKPHSEVGENSAGKMFVKQA